MYGRRITRLVTGLAAVLALAACGAGGTTGAGSADGEGPLRVVTSYPVEGLSPVEQGLWAPEWGYGELLMRATEEGTVAPWVLDGLDRVSDTVWELRLRAGVTFHNGRALDAEALVAMLEGHLADNSRARSALPGATAAVAGRGGSPDEAAVRLTTSRPTPNLPNLLADEAVFPVFDAVALAEAGGPGAGNAALAEAGIYTGPFTVSTLTADALTLDRNAGYWGDDVRLPGVRVAFVPDGQARMLAVRGGEADLAFYPPTEALRGLSGDSEVIEAPGGATPLRGFLNLRAAPLDEPVVRQALALAVDYRGLAEDVMDGFYREPIGMYPDMVPYAERNLRGDPARARQLLDAAGWRPAGDDGIRRRDGERLAITVLSYSTQPDTEVIATALQAQLRETGFDVTVRDVPANYEAMETGSDWHVGLSFDSSLGTTFDPQARLRDFLHSEGQYNFGGVADAELDGLIEELDTTFDEARRTEILRDIQRVTVEEEVYALFLTERPARVVAGPEWADYQASSVLQHVGPRT